MVDSKITNSSFIEKFAVYLAMEGIAEGKKSSLSLLEQNPDSMLLDCGCNDGEFTIEKAKIIGTNNIYGIDILIENVLASQARGIKVYHHDLNVILPFADESFDVVTASRIVEHLSNTDQFIQEIYRVLKFGGYAVISTPNLGSLHNILYLLFGKQPTVVNVSDEIIVGGWGRMYKNPIPGPAHHRLFTLAALIDLCEYYGLHAEKSVGSGFYPFPATISNILTTIFKVYSSHLSIKVRKRHSDDSLSTVSTI